MDTTLIVPAIPPGTPGWWLVAAALTGLLSILWQIVQVMQKTLRERADGKRLDFQTTHKERRDDFAIVRDELRARINELRERLDAECEQIEYLQTQLTECRTQCAVEQQLRMRLEARVLTLENQERKR